MDNMIRPEAVVLPESAMIPERNLLQPAPNQFTHQIVAEQPFFYESPNRNTPPDGIFKAGTLVAVLKHDGGMNCHVVDRRGLYVVTSYNGLKEIVYRQLSQGN